MITLRWPDTSLYREAWAAQRRGPLGESPDDWYQVRCANCGDYYAVDQCVGDEGAEFCGTTCLDEATTTARVELANGLVLRCHLDEDGLVIDVYQEGECLGGCVVDAADIKKVI